MLCFVLHINQSLIPSSKMDLYADEAELHYIATQTYRCCGGTSTIRWLDG